ncbi:MAG: hypothetical protein KGY74_10780 [Candidatus Cloacimonetes bacterium]|nr:hypothetical protein [Candidatus Cloacimonadota bacterium]
MSINRTRYNSFYHELEPKFREFIAKKKEQLKEQGIKFNYKICFEALANHLDKRGLSAKELADRKNIYKGKLIKNWVRNYIKQLEER